MSLIKLQRGNFNQEVISSPVPFFVLFTASWCSPCRTMKSILEEFVDEQGINIKAGIVDVEKREDLAARCEVQTLPTVILFRDGEEDDRFNGLKSKDMLEEMLKM